MWDHVRKRLLWVDIQAGAVLVGEIDAGRVLVTARHAFTGTVGAVACADDGRLLVAGQRHLVVTDAEASVLDTARVIPAGRDSRLNDGGCDPAGRFLVGSMALDDRAGEEMLCRVDHDGRVEVVDDDLTVSNGLAWSPDGRFLYSVDSEPGTVWLRDYDVESGAVGERTPFVHITDGTPDGMCADAAGSLWIAMFGSAQVRCYAASSEQVATVHLGVPNPTSVAFVGSALDRMLITTARHELSADDLDAYPDSGRLFLADVGVRGAPVPLWDGAPIGRGSS